MTLGGRHKTDRREITGRLMVVWGDEAWRARVGRRQDGGTPAGDIGSGIKIETISESCEWLGGRRAPN
jgi:hypothetical protein